MKIETMPLSQLLSMRHARNPKTHDIPELRLSFKRFGFTSPPLIDEATSTVTAGHGRCEALEAMRVAGEPPPDGIIEQGTVWLVPVVRGVSFKSERERDAYLIADNQLTIAGLWNEDVLADLLREFEPVELEGLGFDEAELAELLAPNADSPGTEVDVNGHVRVVGASHKVRPPVQMTNDDWDLRLGDCLEGMKQLADESVDAVVTDPPAGISFMGRSWDGDKGGRVQWIAWLAERAREMLRVLKPGGHGIVWSLPRTQHWTMTALEDAGFELRDVVFHAFSTGFPKSLALDKAIDAALGATSERPVVGVGTSGIANAFNESGETYPTEFERTGPATAAAAAALQGWGTALKPAVEPWIVVRKPPIGTVAENAMKHGTGGINIDATRIGDDVRHNPSASSMYTLGEKPMDDAGGTTAIGRWPSHFILSHTPACRPIGTAEDERIIGVGPRLGDASRGLDFGMGERATTTTTTYDCAEDCAVRALEQQSPGASRFFYTPKPAVSETEAGLSNLPLHTGGEATGREDGSAGLSSPRAGAGRMGGRRNHHPTRKSIALMRYFVRLVTPPGGTVLDPFAGSAATGLAALVEGCKFLGFEQSAEYHTIAVERLRSIIEDPRAAEDADENERRHLQLDSMVK